MAGQDEATLPATRRTRKSIGGGPTTRRSIDKENAAADVSGAGAATRKKSRSKSMGPGGLDILKTGNANRRASLAVPTPRSILKPTIPLIPEIPSYKPKHASGNNGAGGEAGGTKVALRTEEEQQAAAREREERERAQLEKEISDRREARRKSLANRRVSFAAEATLHTFHEIEFMQDSTTSSDSTRRASSIAEQSQQHPNSDPPSTPPRNDQDHAAESPSHQRDVYQRNRRRSSAASSMYGSDDADSVAEVQTEELTGSDDSDVDGTEMTVEAEEMTSSSFASAASPRSAYSPGSTGSLDENLRLAARMAVTQSLDEDEEVIAGFAGWGRKNPSQENIAQTANTEARTPDRSVNAGEQGSDMEMETEMDMDMDMEMTNAIGGILRGQSASPDKEDEINEDLSMDIASALGGILSKAKAFLRRKSVVPSPRSEAGEFGEQTMDFTTIMGGTEHGEGPDGSRVDMDDNEDMSMEFTTAVGGVLLGGFSKNDTRNAWRQTMAPEDGNEETGMMDMTTAVGRILPAESEVDQDEDQTMGMDMTVAVGGIIKSATGPEARSAARKVMEQEADEPDSTTTARITHSPNRQGPTVPDENADPAFSPFRGKGLRRTPPRELSPVARSPAQPSSSPMRQTPSPVRTTAQAQRSPTRTPPSLASRSSSPIRNLSSPTKGTPRSAAKSRLFLQDPSTGVSTPRVVLTPQGRRLSGVGADRPGLGSPRVAEIFDRRESIGEAATDFVPSLPVASRRNVAFADPRDLEAEIERERREEQENEGREGTLNLKEMIQGLSPKKTPFRGRKSLHVGSAVGLLGKRPAELDDDEESEEMDGVKRLKGHQGSPVKNIRLQSPPSKADTTTGRKTRPSIRSMQAPDTRDATPTVASSPQRATTPASQGRSRNTLDYEHAIPMDDADGQPEDHGDRIHLQDFLNMTSIRFMELTTTKRRHTVVPSVPRGSTAADNKDDLSLERCVVAGACTVPMLELYQHSCRELKKYISEGRRIVREIETETFEENPPLFKEYMTASPEFKVLMDNQFKNVKTHARLLSKAMWYEWRMKLQDGLKEGLLKTAEGMENDDRLLAKQQELLVSVLPGMVKRLEALEREREDLETVAEELADCDPKDLEDARDELVAVDKSIAEKARKLEELRRELEESAEEVDSLAQQKQRYWEEIKQADKIREECRGWSSAEINKLKAQTDAIEKQYGWAISSISDTTITMRYKREIELVFDVRSLQQAQRQQHQQRNTSIDVRYVAETPCHCSPEKEFFLRHIREHIRSHAKSATRPSRLLRMVSSAWDKAEAVTEHIRRLNLSFPSSVAFASDDGNSVLVTASVLLVPLQTRLEVILNLSAKNGGGDDDDDDDGLEVVVTPEAKVVYGEQFNTVKTRELLAGRIGGVVGKDGEKKMAWDEAVLELYGRLLAKGKQRQ
ncbi:uncharacterized protein B0T15DRAFT_564435 [Chaetomium strumarium]|uniref:Spc7 kinetochore protein domain-containing protein n=1 Tax=Chaetomium strumarium TaxID=1170767 RepID=A0AAJ0H243_9PEZI|nr:hypothetical protein B0T15DRAFT_564435 [Chaetomium strumarium]